MLNLSKLSSLLSSHMGTLTIISQKNVLFLLSIFEIFTFTIIDESFIIKCSNIISLEDPNETVTQTLALYSQLLLLLYQQQLVSSQDMASFFIEQIQNVQSTHKIEMLIYTIYNISTILYSNYFIFHMYFKYFLL